MRDWRDTLKWFESHNTTSQIGFDPDGQCLKVARTARDIPAKYPTAKAAQDATPKKYRVTAVNKLRKGMVLFFDDPKDSNKAGHIVTMIGRVRGGDVNSLDDVLVETNSVQKGKLTVVRASYFLKHWGDPFQFGANWLNGQVLDYNQGHSKVSLFKAGGPQWNVNYLDQAVDNGRKEIQKYVDQIEHEVKRLPNDKGTNSRVDRFTDYFRRTRILHMGLLHLAVTKGGRTGVVKDVRDNLQKIIKSVPER